MKRITLAIIVSLLLGGCANLHVAPSDNLNVSNFTKIDSVTASLIIDNELQQYIYTGRPTEGRMWGARTFDIELGKPLTATVYKQIKVLIPNTKMSDRMTEGKYDVMVRLKIKKVEFGVVDEDSVILKMALIGPIGGAFSDVVTHVKLTMSAEIGEANTTAHVMEIIGEGSHRTRFYSLKESTFAVDMEKAISDFSTKLTMQLEHDILQKQKVKIAN